VRWPVPWLLINATDEGVANYGLQRTSACLAQFTRLDPITLCGYFNAQGFGSFG
jgi:hypothetical protein